MHSLFVYGTLQEPRVMQAVTGKHFATENAVLQGFRRNRVRDQDYPGIVADLTAEVSGLLAMEVDAAALTRLDLFEGEYYVRENVNVVTEAKKIESCWVYVMSPVYVHLLTNETWNLSVFKDHFLQRFMSTYPHF